MFIQGPDGNSIDCMFFPCTQKEEIKVYTDEELAEMMSPVDLHDDTDKKSSVNRSTIQLNG